MSLRGVNIGRMDMLINIEQYTESLDSIRNQVKTWTAVKSCYAERVRQTGNESIQANQQLATMPVTYKVRHDATITQTMRLYEGSTAAAYYYITDVQHWKREGYTLLTAERRDNA